MDTPQNELIWLTVEQLTKDSTCSDSTARRFIKDNINDLDFTKKDGKTRLINKEKFYDEYKNFRPAFRQAEVMSDNEDGGGESIKHHKENNSIPQKKQQAELILQKQQLNILQGIANKKYYQRTSFWLSIAIIIIVILSFLMGDFAYRQHKLILTVQKQEAKTHFEQVISLKEKAHLQELSSKEELHKKDLLLKENELKTLKQNMNKLESRIADKDKLAQYQEKQIKKYEDKMALQQAQIENSKLEEQSSSDIIAAKTTKKPAEATKDNS
jgi:hypothetical protein